jgi:hypothetical protein
MLEQPRLAAIRGTMVYWAQHLRFSCGRGGMINPDIGSLCDVPTIQTAIIAPAIKYRDA